MSQASKPHYSAKRSATPAAKRMLASGGYAQGGGAMSGVGRLAKADSIAGKKGAHRFARGGRAKGKTEIHIHVGRPQMPGAPAMPMGAPPAMPHPPMGAPPMPPMGGAPMMPPGAPGGMPGAPPPGMPPMPMRARGGRTGYDLGGAAAGAGANAAALNNSSLSADHARLVSELSRYGTHVP